MGPSPLALRERSGGRAIGPEGHRRARAPMACLAGRLHGYAFGQHEHGVTRRNKSYQTG